MHLTYGVRGIHNVTCIQHTVSEVYTTSHAFNIRCQRYTQHHMHSTTVSEVYTTSHAFNIRCQRYTQRHMCSTNGFEKGLKPIGTSLFFINILQTHVRPVLRRMWFRSLNVFKKFITSEGLTNRCAEILLISFR